MIKDNSQGRFKLLRRRGGAEYQPYQATPSQAAPAAAQGEAQDVEAEAPRRASLRERVARLPSSGKKHIISLPRSRVLDKAVEGALAPQREGAGGKLPAVAAAKAKMRFSVPGRARRRKGTDVAEHHRDAVLHSLAFRGESSPPERVAGRWRSVRVYLSATAPDFQRERAALLGQVLPTLNRNLKDRWTSVVLVDMRDAFSEQHSDHFQALRLNEVDFCRPREDEPPLVLALRGNRFGICPPELVPSDKLRFPARGAWMEPYRKSNTQVSLQAMEIHHALQQAHMCDTPQAAPQQQQQQQQQQQRSKQDARMVCMFRGDLFASGIPKEQRHLYEFEYIPDNAAAHPPRPSQVATSALQLVLSRKIALDTALRRHGAVVSVEYECQPPSEAGSGAGVAYDVSSFVTSALQRLVEMIERVVPPVAPPKLPCSSALQHIDRLAQLGGGTLGRESVVGELLDWCKDHASTVCVLRGPSGSGKSSVLGSLCASQDLQAHSIDVVPFCAGQTYQSATFHGMLLTLCEALILRACAGDKAVVSWSSVKRLRRLGLAASGQADDEEGDEAVSLARLGTEALASLWRALVREMKRNQRRVVVVLDDAQNLVDCAISAQDYAAFFQEATGAWKIVVGVADVGDNPTGLARVLDVARGATVVELPPLDPELADEIASLYLERVCAVAQQQATELGRAVASQSGSASPLYVLCACETMHTPDREPPQPRAADLPGLFEATLGWLEQLHGLPFVRVVVTTLAVLQEGLSSNGVQEYLDHVAWESPPASSLAALLPSLSPFLSINTDGRFHLEHPALLGVAHTRYCLEQGGAMRAHRELAATLLEVVGRHRPSVYAFPLAFSVRVEGLFEYSLRHLVLHLREADMVDELARLVSGDVWFLEAVLHHQALPELLVHVSPLVQVPRDTPMAQSLASTYQFLSLHQEFLECNPGQLFQTVLSGPKGTPLRGHADALVDQGCTPRNALLWTNRPSLEVRPWLQLECRSTVTALGFLPGTAWLLTGHASGLVICWNAHNATVACTLFPSTQSSASVVAIGFARNSQGSASALVAYERTPELRVWNVLHNDQPVARVGVELVATKLADPRCAAASKDGGVVAVGGGEDEMVAVLRRHEGDKGWHVNAMFRVPFGVCDVVVSPSGSKVLCQSPRAEVVVVAESGLDPVTFSVKGFKGVGVDRDEDDGALWGQVMCLVPGDGHRLACLSASRVPQLVCIEPSLQVEATCGVEPARALALSTDAKWLLAATTQGIAAFGVEEEGAVRHLPCNARPHAVCCGAHSLVAAAMAHEARDVAVWELSDKLGGAAHSPPHHRHAIVAMATDINQTLLASACAGGAIKVWKCRGWDETVTASAFVDQQIKAVQISPQGNCVVAATLSTALTVLDPQTQQATTVQLESVPTCMCFSQDGRLFIHGGPDGWHMRDTCTWRVCKSVPGVGLRSLAVTPDSRYLVAAGMSNVLVVYDLAEWNEEPIITQSTPHTQSIDHIVFSPDCRTMASIDGDGMVCVWDHDSWELVLTLHLHDHLTSAVFFSDGQLLCCTGRNTVTVVEVDSGSVVAKFAMRAAAHGVAWVFDEGEWFLVCGDETGWIYRLKMTNFDLGTPIAPAGIVWEAVGDEQPNSPAPDSPDVQDQALLRVEPVPSPVMWDCYTGQRVAMTHEQRVGVERRDRAASLVHDAKTQRKLLLQVASQLSERPLRSPPVVFDSRPIVAPGTRVAVRDINALGVACRTGFVVMSCDAGESCLVSVFAPTTSEHLVLPRARLLVDTRLPRAVCENGVVVPGAALFAELEPHSLLPVRVSKCDGQDSVLVTDAQGAERQVSCDALVGRFSPGDEVLVPVHGDAAAADNNEYAEAVVSHTDHTSVWVRLRVSNGEGNLSDQSPSSAQPRAPMLCVPVGDVVCNVQPVASELRGLQSQGQVLVNAQAPDNVLQVGDRVEVERGDAFAVATIAEVCGLRVRLELDGEQNLEDLWVHAHLGEIQPLGTAESLGVELLSPDPQVSGQDFSWREYLQSLGKREVPPQAFAPTGRWRLARLAATQQQAAGKEDDDEEDEASHRVRVQFTNEHRASVEAAVCLRHVRIV